MNLRRRKPRRTAEFDVVVVGFGAAGSAAAITAHDHGARVAIVEKQASDRHTPSVRMSGGAVMCVTDPNLATAYLNQCAGGMVPVDVSAAWAQRASGLERWLRERGGLPSVRFVGGAEHVDTPGSNAIEVYAPGDERTGGAIHDGGAGRALYAGVRRGVEERNITVLWQAPAIRLHRTNHGVSGVVVEGDLLLRARRGVVLACGGFEYDEELKRNYLRAHPSYFYGNPGNSGDGIRLAQQAGSSLWHMNQMVGRAIGSFVVDGASHDPNHRLNFILALSPPGYIVTDRHGRRFADESAQADLRHDFYYQLLVYDGTRSQYPRVPSYWFFDERRRRAGPLTIPQIGHAAMGTYEWSDDNHKEIEHGWISSGSTVSEVADAAGVLDPSEAQRTVEAFNRTCRSGSADPHGRPLQTMIPLDQPPYYCVPLWPGGSHTSGGPERNARAEILDPWGKPIPGLYGAGELGQAIGMIYPANGASLSDAFSFGAIAADSCLDEA